MVYVLSKDGKPLMPTERHGKVRRMLKSGLAKVVKSKPFTIQLLYDTTTYVQKTTLGIDSGYSVIGYSVISENKELISGELKLLDGQVMRNEKRKMYRQNRRNRKRYRKPRFDNRKRAEGWLAPSIEHKKDSHIRLVNSLKMILPISNIIVEVAGFDIQKIKNPGIEGKEYQMGEQAGFYNLREYIFHRDNHTCQNPNCRSRSKILQVHHLGYWKNDYSNRPGNLITLCVNCHTNPNHEKGKFLYGWQPKLKTFRAEAFMTAVRWRIVNELNCQHTYGHITKSKRIELGLPKTHYNDAFVIAGGTNQEKSTPLQMYQTRRNNRSLEKFYDAKVIDIRTGEKVSGQSLNNGRRTRNINLREENLRKYCGRKISKGRRSIRTTRYFYQPKDLIIYQNRRYEVQGMQNKGTYIKLKKYPKVVKTQDIKPYRFMRGICV